MGRPQGCSMTRFVNDGFPALNHHPRILTCRCVPKVSHVALSTPGCATPTHCQGHQLQPRALACSGSDPNCVVRLAKRLQHEALYPPWTLPLERHVQSCHSAKSIPLPTAGQTLEWHRLCPQPASSHSGAQSSPYLPSPGAGSNTGAGLVTAAGCLALVSEDLCSPGKT